MTNIDGLLTVYGNKQLDLTAEMQQLSDSLHSVLKIAEGAQSGSPPSCLTASLDHSDDDTAEDEAQWREFHNFMDEQARERPYPKYLYRAHVHGHPFPRLLDDCTGEYSNTFGSDFHLWTEYDAESQIFIPTCDPIEGNTVDNFFSELNLHLNKTNVSRLRECDGEEPFLSPWVSLSGDFRWTAQRICRVGKMASEDQTPGLALFKTSMIDRSVVRIWRVEDMLLFHDTTLLKSSVRSSSDLRRWAANADEYVCWAIVPQEALMAFITLPILIGAFNGGEKAFLTKEFVGSNYLGDFGRRARQRLSLREYVDRASKFVRSIINNVSSLQEAEQLSMCVAGALLNPWLWGYDVVAFVEDLDKAITSSIETVLQTAFLVK